MIYTFVATFCREASRTFFANFCELKSELGQLFCFIINLHNNNIHKCQPHRPHPAASLLSHGTALHLVVISEASGVAGVALALSHILGQDLATRVGV